jgi:type II restriction/modification system DNA methylase subunit YeeA
MNKANLKSYAPKARLDFIKAVTERANVLGISAADVVPAELRGDVALIDGREWPAKVAGQRDLLIARIKRHGFEQTMDEVAYTWFNRFAALRYMEIHDYLGHGWRVLSSRDGGLPEILRHASEVTLPGLNSDRAREMQLAGNQDNELYKLLLVAQCNELSRAMPFLFERIDDETELLLPENLLRTDSILAKLVEQVPEEDWHEIEVIGWLYQFYISERKEQVIGKVVNSEDIPAATQLFTPNWIVQYLVQNSVGRLWLMANPTSTLAGQWPYYIQPAEQTPEVQTQLDALIQVRIREDGETLNPETITVLDPACGSGHILVVAYDVLKAIYLERGYQPRTIPRLILEKNLYGVDIDDRAGQLAAFALLMKARADDRRLFTDPPKLNVTSLQESKGLDFNELATHLTPSFLQRGSLKEILQTFAHAKTFGSLIQIPRELNRKLVSMASDLQRARQDGDLYVRQAAQDVLPLVFQALLLGQQFDVVVANPPYMGSKGFIPALKNFAGDTFPDAKSDLFAMFMDRGFSWCRPIGFNAMVTMQSWMFLSSYEEFRGRLLKERTLTCMVHMDNGVMGIAFGTAATIVLGCHAPDYLGSFSYCTNDDITDTGAPSAFPVRNERLRTARPDDFKQISGSPIAYWASASMRSAFQTHKSLADLARPKEGLNTTDNERFLRRWWECSSSNTKLDAASTEDALASGAKWFPCQKGGAFRKWFGNNEYVVNWHENGRDIKSVVIARYGSASKRVVNEHLYFNEGVAWSSITSSLLAMRYVPPGHIFETKGNMCFFESDSELLRGIGFLNSCVVNPMIQCVSPTIDFHAGPVGKLPMAEDVHHSALEVAKNSISTTESDWDAFERSWNFKAPPIIREFLGSGPTIESAFIAWSKRSRDLVAEMKSTEERNNRLFIDAYKLQGELAPEIPIEQITLTVNPAYRYGVQSTEAERWSRFQSDAMAELVSYAVGCMMGRYGLDEPGLLYAHGGGIEFDPSRYAKRFPADADGILPVTDESWFDGDAASRLREFLRTVWGAETLETNMRWLAVSLGAKVSETPDETIRRYLAEKFFKDHLQTYKKRPIYWLFSSGKQGGFQALVYLHRYNEGTLARMRAEYVVPLIAKMVSRLDMLNKDVAAASSAAARTKLQKQIEGLRKKQIELLAYDEKLRQYADMRITLDLDDGVKVNYAKFGDLVAESKAITGGSDE